MKNIPCLLVALALAGCAQLPTSNPKGAITALNNLPGKYRNSVVSVYADTAVPMPFEWDIYARNFNDEDKMYLVTVKDGEMRHETPAPAANLRALAKNAYPVNRKQVLVDSDGAWRAGMEYAASKGSKLIDAKISLHQKDSNSGPIWTIRCFDINNNYIGKVVISAQSGDILSTN